LYDQGLSDDGVVEYTVWGGAEQCDLSNGRNDGLLTLKRDENSLMIEFESAGSVLSELNVWVGVTPLPIHKGRFSADPDRFLCKFRGSNIVSADCSVNSLSMDEAFYISIHAVSHGECKD